MAEAGPKKMNWWYLSIIEWMIENPDGFLYECAERMGVTQAWLSCIINSDAFRSAYKELRGEHFSNTSFTVVGKMEGIALHTAELISRKLEDEGENLPMGVLHSTAELALKALGFVGSHGQPSVQVNVNQRVGISVDRDMLAASRERMRQLRLSQAPTSPPIEHRAGMPQTLHGETVADSHEGVPGAAGGVAGGVAFEETIDVEHRKVSAT
jgi:hypothetical protein